MAVTTLGVCLLLCLCGWGFGWIKDPLEGDPSEDSLLLDILQEAQKNKALLQRQGQKIKANQATKDRVVQVVSNAIDEYDIEDCINCMVRVIF